MRKFQSLRNTVLFHLVVATITSLPCLGVAQEQISRQALDLLAVIQEKGWKLGCTEIERELERAVNSVTPRTREWAKMVHLRTGCLSEFGRDLDAVLMLNEALQLEPDDGLLLGDLGTSYLRLGRDQQAIEALDKASKVLPNTDIFAKLAMLRLRMAGPLASPDEYERKRGLLEQAEADIRKAMALSTIKDSPVYSGQLGHVLLAQGRPKEAATLFQEAITLAERFTGWDERLKRSALADYYVSMGQAYGLMGDEHLAKEYIDKGVAIAPTPELRRVLEAIRTTSFLSATDKSDLERRLPEFTGKELVPMD